MGTRDENIFMARLAEQAERYEDMRIYMDAVAAMESELNADERALFSSAYKNSVGARRQAWRAINTLAEREREKGPAVMALLDNFRTLVEKELTERCKQIVVILDDNLSPKATNADAKVFYKKLKGDYYRYLAEFADNANHAKLASEANDAYKAASETATSDLTPTNPVRLGLALNYSVFYYEVFSAPEKACMLAKAAFDDAMAQMDALSEDEYKDSAQIMQLLRDNLTLWTSDMQQVNPGQTAPADGTVIDEL